VATPSSGQLSRRPRLSGGPSQLANRLNRLRSTNPDFQDPPVMLKADDREWESTNFTCPSQCPEIGFVSSDPCVTLPLPKIPRAANSLLEWVRFLFVFIRVHSWPLFIAGGENVRVTVSPKPPPPHTSHENRRFPRMGSFFICVYLRPFAASLTRMGSFSLFRICVTLQRPAELASFRRTALPTRPHKKRRLRTLMYYEGTFKESAGSRVRPAISVRQAGPYHGSAGARPPA
jgi:hypothetical protein